MLLEFDMNNSESFLGLLYQNFKDDGLTHEQIMKCINDLTNLNDDEIRLATERLKVMVHEIQRNNT